MSRLVSIDAMNKINYFLTYHGNNFTPGCKSTNMTSSPSHLIQLDGVATPNRAKTALKSLVRVEVYNNLSLELKHKFITWRKRKFRNSSCHLPIITYLQRIVYHIRIFDPSIIFWYHVKGIQFSYFCFWMVYSFENCDETCSKGNVIFAI